jgi:hypothetical protein
MADAYVAAHEAQWKSRKHGRQYFSTLTAYCKPIWSMPVDQIVTADVMACLTPIWTTVPETASRVRARIETVLDFAKADDEARPNPARWKGHLASKLPNPRKVGKPRGHHTAMPYADVPEFVARLSETPGVAALGAEFHHLDLRPHRRDAQHDLGRGVRRQGLASSGIENEDGQAVRYPAQRSGSRHPARPA